MGSSLEEFAAKGKPYSKAWVNTLPEDVRQEIDGGFDKGISVKTIVRWLKSEKGFSEATDDKVRNYKNNYWVAS